MRIFIVGFMGSGKSTTARQLGKKLGCDVVDLDWYIEAKEGKSVGEIFDSFGEARFREMESEALREVSQSSQRVVVSVGGGTPCCGDNMEYMKSMGVTIYLRHSVGQLASRLSMSKNPRPLLRGLSGAELESFIAEKLSQREEYYNMCSIVADHISRDVTSLVEIVRMHPDFKN